MGYSNFKKQLEDLAYVIEERGESSLSFPYIVESGKFQGKQIKIGLLIPPGFPEIPPSGPNIYPHLLPISGGGGLHPLGGIHKSPLGDEWQYWSRPCNGWGDTDKSVKTYLRHIKHLMDTL